MGLGGGSCKSWQRRSEPKGAPEPPCIVTTHQALPYRRGALAPEGLLPFDSEERHGWTDDFTRVPGSLPFRCRNVVKTAFLGKKNLCGF